MTEVLERKAEQAGQMMQMLSGFWVAQMLHAAAKLGVADALTSAPKTIETLAKTLDAHEDSLYRLLRALSSLGIFQELENRTFAQTPMSDMLRSDVPHSMQAVALMLGTENYAAWSKLYEGVKTGQSAFELTYGMDAYQYFGKNPEASLRFNSAMTAIVQSDNTAILSAYDFSDSKTLVDVGGGHGLLLASILNQHQTLSATLFDLPQVIAEPVSALTATKRCTFESGNFFEAVPSGGDTYILSRVIHGFDDEGSHKILQSIRRVIPTGGKLLLMEFILEPGNSPSTAQTKLMDVNMMVFAPGGRDRTQEEYAKLLENAGFRLSKIYPTNTGIAILEAFPQ